MKILNAISTALFFAILWTAGWAVALIILALITVEATGSNSMINENAIIFALGTIGTLHFLSKLRKETADPDQEKAKEKERKEPII